MSEVQQRSPSLSSIELADRYEPRLKVIKSGDVVEVYWFEFPQMNFGNFGDIKKRKKRLQFDLDYVERRQNRLKLDVERLVRCNMYFDKFLSLTFHENLTDINRANNFFHCFVNRLRSRFPKFKYIAVIEFQVRGAVHYHLLCNLPYVRKVDLERLWSHGFIRIKRIDRIKSLPRYLCKYITKESFDGRLYRKKKFFRSQTLTLPAIWINEQGLKFLGDFDRRLRLVYEKNFVCKFVQTINYKRYELSPLPLNARPVLSAQGS